MTPAIKLLTIVWNSGMKDSWERINHSMRSALRLAIGSGLRFEAKDFTYMASNFRWHYWVGESTEWIYTNAILDGNEWAVGAYERWKGRVPFRANNVESGYHGGFIHRSSVARQRERLAVSLSFPYEDTRAWVTAFHDEGDGLIRAAVYRKQHAEGKPIKLLKLSHIQIAQMFPAPKKTKPKKGGESE
jgi:hypothetical protein